MSFQSASSSSGIYCPSCDKRVDKLKASLVTEHDGKKYHRNPCYMNLMRTTRMDEDDPDYRPPLPKRHEAAQSTHSGTEPILGVKGITQVFQRHVSCIFDECNGTNLVNVPGTACLQALAFRKIYIPFNSRCCQSHLDEEGENFTSDSIHQLAPHKQEATFLPRDIVWMVNQLPKMFEAKTQDSSFAFDCMSEKEIKTYTSLSRLQFDTLVNQLNVSHARKTLIIGLYLEKLTTDKSLDELGVKYKIAHGTVSKYLGIAREGFTSFVANNLGPRAFPREKILENTTSVAHQLYNPNPGSIITVWDGGYIYIQKSACNQFQRLTYSVQKGTNLVKPMLITTTNGLILHVDGPHPAKLNDAQIAAKIMASEMGNYFQRGDIFLADRGFRDWERDLIERGMRLEKPHCHPPNTKDKALTWEQANRTRLVTKGRFIVEKTFGWLKQFKLIDHVWSNKALAHVMDDFKIACALHNAFALRIESDCTAPQVIQRILSRLTVPNHLAPIVKRKQLTPSPHWKKMDRNVIDNFPSLAPPHLYEIATGIHSLNQAVAYYAEHISNEGRFEIFLAQDEPTYVTERNLQRPFLLRARIQSRHSNATKYNAYILADLSKSGVDLFDSWWCSCPCGARTTNPCGHVMCVIWFLTYAQYQEAIKTPGEWLREIFEATRGVVQGAMGEEEAELDATDANNN